MNVSRVLLVDDDDDIRETLAEALGDIGHVIQQARDGREALDVLRASETLPDLILLDLMMPIMDGVEFRREQQADIRLAGVPVVVLSADAAAGTRVAELGVRECLRKPVKLATLVATIERYA
jgi:CheY-like chemotaxis protein